VDLRARRCQHHGWDNNRVAAAMAPSLTSVAPSLTSVAVDHERLGRHGMTCLLAAMRG
jgi:DNA-binding LacI/PurR family transcriptional regulator